MSSRGSKRFHCRTPFLVDRGAIIAEQASPRSFPYSILWGERVLRSVANLTRRDGEEFLRIAPRVPVRVEAEAYPPEGANEALAALRAGRVRGAVVLKIAG